MSEDDHYAHSGSPALVIFCIALTLIVGAVLLRAKDVMPVPFTVLMLFYGLCVGGIMHGWPWLDANLRVYAEMDPHVILGIFIPPLIFEGSAALKWTVLYRVLPQCLVLAVPGVLMNTGMVGTFLKLVLYPEWSWTYALLVGSLMSATDPVAVVATLRDLDADLAVTILTDGEAIMNDGTSIVIFNVLLPAAAGSVHLDAEFFGLNANLLFAGPVLGLILGHILFIALRHARGHAIVSTVYQVAGSYAAFYIAERLCLTSGVITILVMAIYVSRKRGSLTRIDEDDGAIHAFWEIFVWIANAMLFFMVGLIVAVDGVPNATGFDWGALFALYPILFVARAIMMGSLLPLLNVLGVRVTWQRFVMLIHGALRGGIALVLALVIFGEHGISRDHRVSVLFLTSGIVVLTIFINGTTAKFVVNALKINVQPRFARYAKKRAEQQVLALLEVGLREAKLGTGIQLNWSALKELTVDAFNDLRDVENVHATEDVIVPIVLRATKREIWQQRDSGLLSAAAFELIMMYLDDCIQQNRLYDVNELRDYVLAHPPLHQRYRWIMGEESSDEEDEEDIDLDPGAENAKASLAPYMNDDEDDGKQKTTKKKSKKRPSPAMCLLEAEVIAAFADVMEPIEHTVLFLYSRKHSIHDFANWCHQQHMMADELVNDMQHSASHGMAMVNLQTKRSAVRILWGARRSVDRIRDMTGLSINQTHALTHKMHELIHHVKATPALDMTFDFRAFLRSLSLFDGCALTDEQLDRLTALFADDAVETGAVISLDPWFRRAPHDQQMCHTAFAAGCANPRDAKNTGLHGVTSVGAFGNEPSMLPRQKTSGLQRAQTAFVGEAPTREPFEESGVEGEGAADEGNRSRRWRPLAHGRSFAPPPRRRASSVLSASGHSDSDLNKREETVSVRRRRSNLTRTTEAAARVRGRSVFGIVLMGSVAKVVDNRIRHRTHTGEYFGLLRALSDRSGVQEYVALENSELLLGDIKKFRAFLDDFPELRHKVWLNMAVTLVDGILASVFPTAELPPYERLALAKRGRLILVQGEEPITIPAFSSGFLLSGKSIDDPSMRCKISSKLAARSANPNISSRAGHLIPTEVTIAYAPGSYLFVLDDVPLLEARAFVMTHLPFLDAALLQVNLGVSSFVRSLFKGQDRIASLFRIIGDVLGIFPTLAKLMHVTCCVLAEATAEEKEKLLVNLINAGLFDPATRRTDHVVAGEDEHMVFADTKSDQPVCEAVNDGNATNNNDNASGTDASTAPTRREHTFVTAEDQYDGDKDETDYNVQRSVEMQDAKRLQRRTAGAEIAGVPTLGDEAHPMLAHRSPAKDDGATDRQHIAATPPPAPSLVVDDIIDMLRGTAAEVMAAHQFLQKVILQQYTSQVKVRQVVKRIAAFFRLFNRTPTKEDPSPRPVWVRAVYDVLTDDVASRLYSSGKALDAITKLVETHKLITYDEAAAFALPRPGGGGGDGDDGGMTPMATGMFHGAPDSPIASAFVDAPFGNDDELIPTSNRGTLDRIADRLPHAVCCAAFGTQRTVAPKRTEGTEVLGDANALASGTPSMLEGRGGGGSFRRVGSFAGSVGSHGSGEAGVALNGTFNGTLRGSIQRLTAAEREEKMMAAVNDFDE